MRPKDCFSVVERRRAVRPRQIVTVARYALHGAVLPRMQEALSLGELARQFLQGIYGRQNEGDASAVLSGKSPAGEPLAGHEHAMYLPTDEDRDGRLDHLTVWALGGFRDADLRALDALRRLRQVGGKPDLEVVLTGLGTPADFRRAQLFGPARVWRSATPFVPVRHVKKRRGAWIDRPEDQVLLELQRRGKPEPVSVHLLERCELGNGRSLRWIEFRRERLTGRGEHSGSLGYGFEITFDQEVWGPLALGYGCHFGLGQFGAVGK